MIDKLMDAVAALMLILLMAMGTSLAIWIIVMTWSEIMQLWMEML